MLNGWGAAVIIMLTFLIADSFDRAWRIYWEYRSSILEEADDAIDDPDGEEEAGS